MLFPKTLKARMDALADHAPPTVREAFDGAMSFPATISAKKAELAAPGVLSDKGVTQALRDHLSRGPVAELRRRRDALTAEDDAIKAARRALVQPKIDRGDVVGEMQRQETRRWFRDLPAPQRLSVLTDNPAVFEAVAAAPAHLSGLDADQFDRLSAQFAARHMPEEVAALAAREEANNVAAMAIEAAVKALGEHAAVGSRDLSAWLDDPATPPPIG